jgi:uncharacterized protein (DUF362 family)/ferredoxin
MSEMTDNGRREFIGKGMALGVAAGAALLLGHPALLLAQVTPAPPDLVAVKGGEPDVLFRQAIKLMGGMGRFIKKGQTVLVKPNIAFPSKPEYGANTNPLLVRAVVEHCFLAGARKVYVFDNVASSSIGIAAECYRNSGIELAAREAGAIVAPGDDERYYQRVDIPGGVNLKKTKVHELLLTADVLINVPVVKHHSYTYLTAAMKNLMGVVWDRQHYHSAGLDQCIADFCLFRKPDLNVVDAYRVMLHHGPRGAGLADVALRKMLLLSRDIVAVDTAAARLIGLDPADVYYLNYGQEHQLGTMNLDRRTSAAMSSAKLVLLKNLRRGIGAAVFGLCLLLFLGGPSLSETLTPLLRYWQAVPALVRFVVEPALLTAVPLLLLLAATMLLGRVYCACLCPLGVLQDLVIRLRHGRGRSHAPFKRFSLVRYPLGALTWLTAALGSFALLDLLDPWSLFSRLGTHLFKPALLGAGNLMASILEQLDIYAIPFHKLLSPPAALLVVILCFGILPLIFTLLHVRAWCNLFCPVGILLGLLSRYSLFAVRLDTQRCNGCRRCEAACKAGCIDLGWRTVDTERCLVCFNCIAACPREVLTYGPAVSAPPARRAFLLASAAAGGSVLNALADNHLLPAGVTITPRPIVPPGAISQVRFNRTCTACHLCVSACPTQVLSPAYLAYGFGGLFQPRLDYSRGHCEFACHTCGLVCPTGAIAPLSLTAKQRTRIGTARLCEKLCVVHLNKKHCGACGEACPTHAIIPVEKGEALFPTIEQDYCIGCGACEKACPTRPKAITVTASSVHRLVKTRHFQITTGTPQPVDERDFPF